MSLIGVQVKPPLRQDKTPDIQAAVELAGRRFKERTGQPPTHVELPEGVNPETLELWTLEVLPRPAKPPGTVMVGRLEND